MINEKVWICKSLPLQIHHISVKSGLFGVFPHHKWQTLFFNPRECFLLLIKFWEFFRINAFWPRSSIDELYHAWQRNYSSAQFVWVCGVCFSSQASPCGMSEDAENVDILFEVFAVVRGRHAGDARDVNISFRVQVGVCGSRGERLVLHATSLISQFGKGW